MSQRTIKRHIPNLCKCQPPAIPQPKTLLRKTNCKKCGIIFSTNRDTDFCKSCLKDMIKRGH